MPGTADIRAAAALLGALGGSRNTEAQRQARSRNAARNGARGGRPRVYRLAGDVLQKRHGDRWLDLQPPYDAAAKAFLRRSR